LRVLSSPADGSDSESGTAADQEPHQSKSVSFIKFDGVCWLRTHGSSADRENSIQKKECLVLVINGFEDLLSFSNRIAVELLYLKPSTPKKSERLEF